MIPFLPKAGLTPAAGGLGGLIASCFTRKKGVKRDLPESQSSPSELEPTGSPLGSAPGTCGQPPSREEAQWSGRHPAGGARESRAASRAAWRRADKATLHISEPAEETLLEQEGFSFLFCFFPNSLFTRCPRLYCISAVVEQATTLGSEEEWGRMGLFIQC